MRAVEPACLCVKMERVVLETDDLLLLGEARFCASGFYFEIVLVL